MIEKPKWLLPSAAVLVLVVVILYALGLIGGGEKVEPGRTSEPAVEALPADAETRVVSKNMTAYIQSWPGTIRSRTIANIAPKYTARIISIHVNAGDRVNKGDVLARLDEREMSARVAEIHAQLAAAKAQAAQASADAKRIRVLYEKEAATRENYDAVIARSSSAQALVQQSAKAVEQMRVSLGENTLKAPFAGIITERLKEPGDMGMPGDAVVILQKADDLRLEVALPSACAGRIKIGMEVDVRIDSANAHLKARIDEIVPEIDQDTRSQLVKAVLPAEPGLQHGQFAWLEQNCSDDQAVLMIPARAVLHYGQLEAVKVLENNQLVSRHIRTGKQRGTDVEVLSGLREGETILIDSGLPK
jgi:RND family efflux transporter MFP subunit